MAESSPRGTNNSVRGASSLTEPAPRVIIPVAGAVKPANDGEVARRHREKGHHPGSRTRAGHNFCRREGASARHNRFRDLGRLQLATEKQKRDGTVALPGIPRTDGNYGVLRPPGKTRRSGINPREHRHRVHARQR